MINDLVTDVCFSDLDLDSRLLDAIEDVGFDKCTPIQASTLPLLLAGQDVAGQAQTGTGKTAAYLLAIMNHMLVRDKTCSIIHNKPAPAAMILAPTRELAIQIAKDAESLGKHTKLKIVLVYGGVDYEKQKVLLGEGADILIGTPGRVIDYFKQGVFSLKGICALVLDEADRMFDLGFIKDLRFLLRKTPHPSLRLTMLYSATLSFRVNELAYEHMNNPRMIQIEPDKRTAEKVQQTLYHVSSDEKIKLLVGIMREQEPNRTIVFVNTKRAATFVMDYLNSNGYLAKALSGDLVQKKRERLIEQFKAGEVDIVVATDVAARGLHIPDISHVVNYDLPQNAEDYVHRIGRTARAGASGDAISLACEEFVFSLENIEEYIGYKLPVTRYSEEMLADVKKPDIESVLNRKKYGGRRFSGGRSRGKRNKAL